MPRSEEKVWQYRISLFLIFAIFPILGNVACKRTQRFQAYDGTWWMSTPLDQRLGFVDGFVDCYTYGQQSTKPRNWCQAAISAYYEKHSGETFMHKRKPYEQKRISRAIHDAGGHRGNSAWPKRFGAETNEPA
jgi:hypothetical protein